MASDEEIRLILNMGKSGADVEAVRAKLDEMKASAATTNQVIQVQTTALDALGISLKRTAGLYDVVTTEAQQAAQVIGASHPRSIGQAALAGSYAVQDFTSQLGTRGLAGGLYENWDKVARLWGSGKTEEEIERVKKLTKATEEAAEAAEKLAKTLTPERRAEGPGALKRATDAFGGEAVVKELAEAIKGARGDFGAENNRNMAKTLMANLNLGNRDAIEFLQTLPLQGPVGRVLGGGPTPDEVMKAQGAARKEQEAKAKAFRDKQAQEDAQEKRRIAQQNLEGQRNADRAREQQDKEKDDRVRESQQLARGVNRGLQQREQGFTRAPVGQHLPTIPQGATPQETMRVLIDSQARLEANSRMDREALRRAREINQKIRSAATAGLP